MKTILKLLPSDIDSLNKFVNYSELAISVYNIDTFDTNILEVKFYEIVKKLAKKGELTISYTNFNKIINAYNNHEINSYDLYSHIYKIKHLVSYDNIVNAIEKLNNTVKIYKVSEHEYQDIVSIHRISY